MNGTVIIIRGTAGSTKSSFAIFIKNLMMRVGEDCIICEADEFFYDEKHNYNFDKTKLFQAHKYCQNKFIKAIDDKKRFIIVSNTSVRESDIKFYMDYAKAANYTIFCMVMENRNGTKDLHNVPLETLQKQDQLLRNNLKFLP